mmetsp:Transcript_52308/g.121636  ORF Transcript_52308/g.121636 Transcript_52308/m.121636 type:complete len:233 (+) Transcript_52308:371-1069(+)
MSLSCVASGWQVSATMRRMSRLQAWRSSFASSETQGGATHWGFGLESWKGLNAGHGWCSSSRSCWMAKRRESCMSFEALSCLCMNSICRSMRLSSMGVFEKATCSTPRQNSLMSMSPLPSMSSASNISTGLFVVRRPLRSCWSSLHMLTSSSREISPEPSTSRRTNICRSSLSIFFFFCASRDLMRSLSCNACSMALLTMTAVTRFMSATPTTKMARMKKMASLGSASIMGL